MYEENHYIRILDGKNWCADQPFAPSKSEVLKQIAQRREKGGRAWLNASLAGSEPWLVAYNHEVEKTKDALSSSDKIKVAQQEALKICEARLEDFLSETFRTNRNKSGKPYLRNYKEKSLVTQVGSIATQFLLSPEFVLRKAKELGVKVRDEPLRNLDERVAQAEPLDEVPAPSWVGTLVSNMAAWSSLSSWLQLMPGQCTDLYLFLNATQGDSLEDIAQKCGELSALFDKADKINPKGKGIASHIARWDTQVDTVSRMEVASRPYQIEIGVKLCSKAGELFKTEEGKTFYDALLRLDRGKVLDFLNETLPQWLDCVNGTIVISNELYEAAIERVRRNASSENEAKWLVWYFLSGCKKKEELKCKRLPPDVSELVCRAEELISKQKFKEALEILAEALRKCPDDSAAKECKKRAEDGIIAVRAAAEKVAAAEHRIQDALGSKDVETAANLLSSVRHLPGIDIAKWEQAIEDIKALIEKERKAKAVQEEFEKAISTGKWNDAERFGRELEKIGVKTADQWKSAIQDAKNNRKKYLERQCAEAIAKAQTALNAKRLDEAESEVKKIENAVDTLRREYKSQDFFAQYKKLSHEIQNAKRLLQDEKRKKEAAEALRKRIFLSADALSGMGEGQTGKWGVVTLRWRVPAEMLTAGRSVRLILSRSDGAIKDEDVFSRGGQFEDKNVEVGREYVYILRQTFDGQPNGESQVNVKVTEMRPPLPVTSLRAAKLANRTWRVLWDWPDGVEIAMVVMSRNESVSPAAVADTPLAQPIMRGADRQSVTDMPLLPDTKWIIVFSVKRVPGSLPLYSEPVSVPVTVVQHEILCEIIAHPGGIFRKRRPHDVLIHTKAGRVPDMVLVDGGTKRPSRASDGIVVDRIPAGNVPTDGIVRREAPLSTNPSNLRLFLSNPVVDANDFKIAPMKVKE